MTTLNELNDRLQRCVSEARQALDQIDTPGLTESRIKELEQQHDRNMAEYDKLKKRVDDETRLAEIEAEMSADERDIPNIPEGKPSGKPKDGEPTYETAYRNWIKFGNRGLNEIERKLMAPAIFEQRAQGTNAPSVGGYTSPGSFRAKLIERMKAWGPMLDPGVTTIETTSDGNSILWPTMDDTDNEGALLTENTADSEQDVEFGAKQIDAYFYTSRIVRVSQQWLQDSAIDPEATLIGAFAKRLGRKGNKDLTTANGISKPNGIVAASSSGKTAAATGSVTFDELIDLQHSVDPAYRGLPGCRWMFNDTVLQALRKIKNDGEYIWQSANVQTGAPALLLEKPYSINQAMASMSASTTPVLFGDLSAYLVRIAQDIATQRLVERYAEYHQVGFVSFMRIDGELLDVNACKKLTMAAA